MGEEITNEVAIPAAVEDKQTPPQEVIALFKSKDAEKARQFLTIKDNRHLMFTYLTRGINNKPKRDKYASFFLPLLSEDVVMATISCGNYDIFKFIVNHMDQVAVFKKVITDVLEDGNNWKLIYRIKKQLKKTGKI